MGSSNNSNGKVPLKARLHTDSVMWDVISAGCSSVIFL